MASASASAAAASTSDREKKMEKLKKEIRSILQTAAKTGLSPEELERDYRDLNGRRMDYESAGFCNIYELLDAIPDVVEAYDVGGQIVLFAVSTRETAHLERLIAKAKPSRLGRFGGVIQQPAVCRRGTPERRKFIEKRLVDVAMGFSGQGFTSYQDICKAYLARYREDLDPKGDFGCQPVAIFNIKFSHLFDVENANSRAHFLVRLKPEARKEREAELGLPPAPPTTTTSTSNILGAGGFNEQRPASAESAHHHQVFVSTGAGAGVENIPPPGAFSIRPEQLLESIARSRASTPSSFPPPPFPMPGGLRPFFPPPMPYHHPQAAAFAATTRPGGGSPASAPAPFPPMVFSPAVHQLFQQMGHHRGVGGGPGMVPGPSGGPGMVPGPGGPEYAGMRWQALGAPFFYPMPPAFYQQQYPSTSASTSAPMPDPFLVQHQAQEREFQLQQLQQFQQQFQLQQQQMQRPPKSDSADSGVPASGEATMVEPPPPPPESSASASAPRPPDLASLPPPSDEMFATAAAASSGYNQPAEPELAEPKKMEPEPEKSSVCGEVAAGSLRSTKASETGKEEPVPAPTPIPAPALPNTDTLKMQCRQVLARFPCGIPYLEFGKAYRKIIGRELDLEPFNVLSVRELIEDVVPDVFDQRPADQRGGILLFAKGRRPAPTTTPTAIHRAKGHRDSMTGWAENAAQDALVGQIWRVVWNQPGKTMFIDRVPAAFQEVTGNPFPLSGRAWEDFGLVLFEYNDRFDFIYENKSTANQGKLRLVAQPDPDYEELTTLSAADIGGGDSGMPSKDPYGRNYEHQRFPVSQAELETMDPSDQRRLIQVLMAQVHSPGHFYVQLVVTYPRLEALMQELNDYFNDDTKLNKAQIDPADITKGTACACFATEEGVWYRGLVEGRNVEGNGEFRVLLVDFGTAMAMNGDCLRYMPRAFFDLPAQAILSRLAFLAPPPPSGQDWTMESGEMMAALCGPYELCAELYKFDQSGVVAMALTVGDGKETLVSDALIDAGMAQFYDELQARDNDPLSSAVELLESELQQSSLEPIQQGPAQQHYTAPSPVESVDDILNTAMEEEVVQALQESLKEEEAVDSEVFYTARTYLCRRRLAINGVFTRQAADKRVIQAAVDKLHWLEKHIEWLNGLCD